MSPSSVHLVSSLTEMGFDQRLAREAVSATQGESLMQALSYITKLSMNTSTSTDTKRKDKGKGIIADSQADDDDDDDVCTSPVEVVDDDMYDFVYDDDDDNDDDNGDDDDDDVTVFDDDADLVYVEDTSMRPRTCTAGCLDLEGIVTAQTEESARVAGVLNMDASDAATLLRHFKWDTEKLLEKFFEDKSAVMALAGLSEDQTGGVRKVSVCSPSDKSEEDVDARYDCGICGDDDLSSQQVASASCGEVFCTECWNGYLSIRIKEGDVATLSCMGFKCNANLDADSVRRLVSPELYQRYQHFLSRSFVEDSKNIQWCPAPGCGNAVVCQDPTMLGAHCKCGYRFCFNCSQDDHTPATCSQVHDWEKKCRDDSATCKWISVNTQTCPKCFSAIEKNGGCNHMTCRKCNHQFCWLCLQDWFKHSNCNAYREKNNNNQSKAAKESLQRYLFYFHRYDSHKKNQELEKSLREQVQATMRELYESVEGHLDTSFVEEAVETLISCRRTLMYTYISAFYLDDGPEKTLFEYLQSELETNTEKLGYWVESDFEYNFEEKRLGLINCTRSASQRLRNMYEGFANGFLPQEP